MPTNDALDLAVSSQRAPVGFDQCADMLAQQPRDDALSGLSGRQQPQSKMDDLLIMQAEYWAKRRCLDRHDDTATASASSSGRPHRFFNRRVVELDEAALKLGTSNTAPADKMSYVRLLSSKNFDTQDLARHIRELPDHIHTRSSLRGKLEGSSIEGYIAHQQDTIVIDAIVKARERVEQEVQYAQRANWSWAELMGPSGPCESAAERGRIVPTVSRSSNLAHVLAGAAGSSPPTSSTGTLLTPLAGDSQAPSERQDAFDRMVGDMAMARAARSPAAAAPALQPVSCLLSLALPDAAQGAKIWQQQQAQEEEDVPYHEAQYAHSLRLLQLMCREAPNPSSAGSRQLPLAATRKRERESGQFAALGLLLPLQTRGALAISEPRALTEARKVLTDGALGYFHACFVDEHPAARHGATYATVDRRYPP